MAKPSLPVSRITLTAAFLFGPSLSFWTALQIHWQLGSDAPRLRCSGEGVDKMGTFVIQMGTVVIQTGTVVVQMSTAAMTALATSSRHGMLVLPACW